MTATVPEAQARLHEKLRRELGEHIMGLLDDWRTEDVCVNADGAVMLRSTEADWKRVGELSPWQALAAARTVASMHDTVLDHSRPILETELPFRGERFEAIVAPIVDGTILAIRCRPRRIHTLQEYERAGIISMWHMAALRRLMGDRERKNVLIVGPTGSGKTTLLNACLNYISSIAPDDRIVTIEDTPELQCSSPNRVALTATAGTTILDCLKAALRLRPTRIIVGEVRDREAHALLKVWNTGQAGGLATVHANDAVAGLDRLQALVEESTGVPQQRLIAEAVNVVVFIAEDEEHRRKVREVVTVKCWNRRENRYEVEQL